MFPHPVPEQPLSLEMLQVGVGRACEAGAAGGPELNAPGPRGKRAHISMKTPVESKF